MGWFVIFISFGYLLGLFFLAAWADKKKELVWLRNKYTYALTIAVYCTAWTYYGSVGRAASNGIDFLTTYVGPILLFSAGYAVLLKIFKVSKSLRITTVADFIGVRYGKSSTLGALVAIVCFLAIIPYISLQLKAIAYGLEIISPAETDSRNVFWLEPTFYLTALLGVFSILYGARRHDSSKPNTGLVAVVAFESLFKLVVFLAVGLYVTYVLFGGFADVFRLASEKFEGFSDLVTIEEQSGGYTDWFFLNLLSAIAIVLLPRQFHVMVKENTEENLLRETAWLLPLYLVLINLFVMPIALGGNLLFAGENVNADTYVLSIPISQGETLLTIFAYLGGFSAAASMVIVSTTALGLMLGNNLLAPLLIKRKTRSSTGSYPLARMVVRGRQLLIIVLLALAYLYFSLLGEQYSLVSIGLISFVGVAQLAPAFFGGLYWKQATKGGAASGIVIGTLMWTFLLVLPTLPNSIAFQNELTSFISFGVLETEMMLGVNFGSEVVAGFVWSLLANMLCFMAVSAISKPNSKEANQAEIFVDIAKYSSVSEQAIFWKGQASKKAIRLLLHDFLGEARTERALLKFNHKHGLSESGDQADFRMVNYAEKLLSGIIGNASAKILMATIVTEEEISLKEVTDILKETQRYVSDNKELKKKSAALKKATDELQNANTELQKMNELKNEFIGTVTHELRTPLTSIRAFSEILEDGDDLSADERSQFLSTIIVEVQRMERLINQVLDIEKISSGETALQRETVDVVEMAKRAIQTIEGTLMERKVALEATFPPHPAYISADKDRLLQVLLNLLSNAIKFANPENRQIELEVSQDREHVELSVSDNGKGLPAADIEHVFSAFFQSRNQNFKKPEGTGLGLTISQKIIEKHEGIIWVENQAEGGAIFSIKLPLVHQYEKSIDS